MSGGGHREGQASVCVHAVVGDPHVPGGHCGDRAVALVRRAHDNVEYTYQWKQELREDVRE